MRKLPGLFALALIAAIVAASLAGLIIAGGEPGLGSPARYIRRLVVASLGQAALSTALALLLGGLMALALARRTHFPGRGFLIAAMNVATVLPTIVVVFAMVAVYGRSGWTGQTLNLFGLDVGSWLFGLPGILLAHVFFNAPLAARVFLASLSSIPAEHWRLAEHLGMGARPILRYIDGPVLVREAGGLAALVFLVCFTSFAIVLALGGGPATATLEVAIFEALRFEAAFRRAALLAALQIAICLALVVPILALAGRPAEIGSAGADLRRPDRASIAWRIADPAVILLVGAMVIVPLASIVTNGAGAISAWFSSSVARALATSILIGVPAGLLGTLLSILMASLARTWRVREARNGLANGVGVIAMVILVVSPMALSAGLFVVLRPLVNPLSISLALIVLVNALMALPFAYRQVEPPLTLSEERYGRLADSLGLTGATRIRIVDWPMLKRPLAVALTVATALSLGDLGVAAFFGTGDMLTLPLLIHRQLGAYRMDDAAAVSLLLSLLILLLFVIAQRWSGGFFARGR